MTSVFEKHRWMLMFPLFFLIACGEADELPTAPIDDDPIDQSATFRRVQDEIFTPSCTAVGCHDALIPSEGLILVGGQSYGLIVNVPSRELSQLDRIEPGDPEASYLFWKITGRTGIVGEQMPQGGPPLNAAQVRLVRDWIRRGAPND